MTTTYEWLGIDPSPGPVTSHELVSLARLADGSYARRLRLMRAGGIVVRIDEYRIPPAWAALALIREGHQLSADLRIALAAALTGDVEVRP